MALVFDLFAVAEGHQLSLLRLVARLEVSVPFLLRRLLIVSALYSAIIGVNGGHRIAAAVHVVIVVLEHFTLP